MVHRTRTEQEQRPTAKELLKHKFIRTAKKASYLTELIERHEKWKMDKGAQGQEQLVSELQQRWAVSLLKTPIGD